jgi:hypothetical protein
MKNITRRQFLKAGTIGAGAAVLGASGGFRGTAQAAPPTYTGVTYLTPAYEDLFPPIVGFVNQLKKHPDLFKIDFFDSGTLVKTDEQTAALRAGTITSCSTPAPTSPGLSPSWGSPASQPVRSAVYAGEGWTWNRPCGSSSTMSGQGQHFHAHRRRSDSGAGTSGAGPSRWAAWPI